MLANSFKMNVIIVIKKGIMDTPILVQDDITAQATFNNLAEELLGDDISEVNLHSDSCVNEVNNLLDAENEIRWFVDINVNTYINGC